MCGRYSNNNEFSETRLAFQVERDNLFREYRPTYNISPSYGPRFEQLIVVRNANGQRELRLARWWFIPSFWQKPLKDLPLSFNARAEEVEKKTFWREAFRSKRCLVPGTGWREFKGSRGHKQPYHFQVPQGSFAFAGLWSTWISSDGEVVDSFAIVTTEPNAVAKEIHNRMPLIMPEADYDAWLDPHADPAEVLARACEVSQARALDVYPSNPAGNRSGVEGPEVLERFSEPSLFDRRS